jgi:hypothetical protein
MDYLREHLGVFYRGYLEGGVRAYGKMLTSMSMTSPDPVEAILPDFRSKDTVVCSPVTIGSTKVTIQGEIGLIDKKSDKTKSRLFYYRHALDSQGVDIRVGDRVVATKLINEIWEEPRHPLLNGLAGEFRIPAVRDAIPPTLNNKTSLDFDSSSWQSIADSIRQAVPEDELPYGGGKSEDDLRDELFTHIEGLKKPTHEVSKEYDCGHGVFVDIMWNQSVASGPVDIFEVKKGKAQVIDLYQLVMYWDGLVSVGVQPTHGHLVCTAATPNVHAYLPLLCGRSDANGKKYDLVVEGWDKHGIKP